MIESFWTELSNHAYASNWVSQLFVVVFITLLLDFLQKRILRKVSVKTAATKNIWDDALIEALRKPLSLLIWVLGLSFALELIRQLGDFSPIFSVVSSLRDTGVIVSLTWFVLRFIKHAQHGIIETKRQIGEEVDYTTIDAVGKLLRVSVTITAVLVLLQTLGYSVSGVMAFGGVGGIAVGFAAKDLLANFFGGLMIHLDRPFAVGDWIRSPDREIEGTVVNIGWRQTQIMTFDKRPLYVPNSVFANIAVQNPSRMTHRRIYETIGIRYADADKMTAITDEIRTMLMADQDIDQSQTLMVNFNAFAPSSVDFFIYTFTRTTVWTEFHSIKHRILLDVNDIIAKHGAEVAFPTSTLHVADEIRLTQG